MLVSYLQFHLVFTAPPLLLLAGLIWPEKRRPEAFWGLIIICVAAFVWTTPWDNLLVQLGVWSYPEGSVIGRIGYVPIEEYLFFALQSLFTGLIFFALRGDLSFSRKTTSPALSWLKNWPAQWWLAVFIAGCACLLFDRGTYLGLILVWATPILFIQSLYGAPEILRHRRFLFLSWVGPTFYLCLADSWAIVSGLWTIHAATSTGLMIGPLPLEEALFFALTNLMVIQGLLCFQHAWETRFARVRGLRWVPVVKRWKGSAA